MTPPVVPSSRLWASICATRPPGSRLSSASAPPDTAGALFEVDWCFPRGGSVPPHVHRYQEEAFEILSGRAWFRVSGRRSEASQGQGLTVPPGAVGRGVGRLANLSFIGGERRWLRHWRLGHRLLGRLLGQLRRAGLPRTQLLTVPRKDGAASAFGCARVVVRLMRDRYRRSTAVVWT